MLTLEKKNYNKVVWCNLHSNYEPQHKKIEQCFAANIVHNCQQYLNKVYECWTILLKEHYDEKIVCLLLISIRHHLNIDLQDALSFLISCLVLEIFDMRLSEQRLSLKQTSRIHNICTFMHWQHFYIFCKVWITSPVLFLRYFWFSMVYVEFIIAWKDDITSNLHVLKQWISGEQDK